MESKLVMQSVYEYVIMMIDLSFCESLLALENSRATEQKGAIIIIIIMCMRFGLWGTMKFLFVTEAALLATTWNLFAKL